MEGYKLRVMLAESPLKVHKVQSWGLGQGQVGQPIRSPCNFGRISYKARLTLRRFLL